MWGGKRGGHLRWTFTKTVGPVVVPIQPGTGSRCGAQWQPDLGEVSGLEGGKPLAAALEAGQCMGGVWPLSLRAAVGSQAVKSGAFHAVRMAEGRMAEGQCVFRHASIC